MQSLEGHCPPGPPAGTEGCSAKMMRAGGTRWLTWTQNLQWNKIQPQKQLKLNTPHFFLQASHIPIPRVFAIFIF